LVLDCAPNYRLPETTRWAHRVAGGASLPRVGWQIGLDLL
jgi:hypothetical protein